MIDFGRLFGTRSQTSRRVSPPGDSSSAQIDPVRVGIPSLLALRRAAMGLSLQPRHIRARQGGNYLSSLRGLGMEFDEARPYQPGDEVRHLDWRVTARTGKPHTKLFREERERPVLLWVDYRVSMFFATRGFFKAVLAARVASLLAWSAKHHGDRVGSIIFSENIHQELKPRRGHAGVMHLIGALTAHPAWHHRTTFDTDKGSAKQAFMRLQRVARPGSLIFLISDFRHWDDSIQSQLGYMSHHCDIVMFMIHDPLERNLPPPGQYRVSNGQRDIDLDTRDREFRRRYAQRFKDHQWRLRAQARRYGFQFLSCATTENPLDVLKQGLNEPLPSAALGSRFEVDIKTKA